MAISARYLVSLFGGLLLLFLIWFGAFFSQLDMPTASSRWASELFKQKSLAASYFEGTRIFIVGGSGVHFSVSAEAISKELGIPTINYGSYAGLEAEYMLYKVKQVLRSGDIVLLPFEYSYYGQRPKYNKIYLDHIFARDPAFLKTLSLQEQLQFALRVSINRIKLPYKEKLSRYQPYVAPLGYYTSYYNAYGDTHVNNRIFLTDAIRTIRATASVIDSGMYVDPGQSDLWKALRPFAAWCKENNITVLATAPTHQLIDNIRNDALRKTVAKIKALYAELGILYIGNPSHAMFEKEFYFDTSYHTNELGKKLYSQYLIKVLKKALTSIKTIKTDKKLPVVNQKNPLEAVLLNFSGWEPIQGLEAMEFIRTDISPIMATGEAEIILQVESLKGGRVVLSSEFLPNLDRKNIEIFLDANLVWHHKYDINNDQYFHLELPLNLTKGKHLIKMRSLGEKHTDNKIAINFKSLLIQEKEITDDNA